ncbi:hypothetical protein F8M41_015805 [Gigaspora margarita]|uniref:Uncharacterized protein n=1 Tax=Gigaspora margarita TaxID=4874 RepID=A0A8H3ZW03_GIGMA|nr:hypothetical protein F8M41_015805 [Gigaspora margarita]
MAPYKCKDNKKKTPEKNVLTNYFEKENRQQLPIKHFLNKPLQVATVDQHNSEVELLRSILLSQFSQSLLTALVAPKRLFFLSINRWLMLLSQDQYDVQLTVSEKLIHENVNKLLKIQTLKNENKTLKNKIKEFEERELEHEGEQREDECESKGEQREDECEYEGEQREDGCECEDKLYIRIYKSVLTLHERENEREDECEREDIDYIVIN